MKFPINFTTNLSFVVLLTLAILNSGVRLDTAAGKKSGPSNTFPQTGTIKTPERYSFEDLNPVSKWITLSGLFYSSTKNLDYQQRYYNAISQWIVLNGLFYSGYDSSGFNRLDPISQWIILEGLFGEGNPNDRYNDINQWIVLNALFNPAFYGNSIP